MIQLLPYFVWILAWSALFAVLGRILTGASSSKGFSTPLGFVAFHLFMTIGFEVGLSVRFTAIVGGFVVGSIGVVRWVLVHRSSRSFTCQTSSVRDSLKSFRNELIQIVALAAFSTLIFARAILHASDNVPSLTSFDTTSGDMFSYLYTGEALRNVGWYHPTNFQTWEFSPLIGESLETFFRTSGSGGTILLGGMAGILNLPTWQIGQISLLTSFVALILSAANLLRRVDSISTGMSVMLVGLFFTSSSFLTVLGWWPLNQIVFSTFLFVILDLLRLVANQNSLKAVSVLGWTIGSTSTLSIVSYPSAATYSLVPLLLAAVVLTFLNGNPRKLIPTVFSISVFLPHVFLMRGYAQNLRTVFSSQVTHKLDMGFGAPSALEILGIGWSKDSFTQGAPFSVGASALIFLVVGVGLCRKVWKWKANKSNDKLSVCLISLFGVGASVMCLLALTQDQNSYRAHKLILLWAPILFVIAAFSLQNTKTNVFEGGLGLLARKFRITLIAFAAISIGANTFVAMKQLGEPFTNKDALRFNTVSKDLLEVIPIAKERGIEIITTDFGQGSGWSAGDRTAIPGLVTYPGPLILAGAFLASTPQMTGWTVGTVGELANGSIRDEFFVNSTYSLRFICRFICASPRDSLSAWVQTSALPTASSSLSFADRSKESVNTSNTQMTIYISGKPSDAVLVKMLSANEDKSCPTSPTFLQVVSNHRVLLDQNGRGLLQVEEHQVCSITIGVASR